MISIKLLCLNFSMGVLLEMCSIFSEHLFLRAHQKGCFCNYIITKVFNYVKEYTNKKCSCSFRKHERFIYLKVTIDLNGARKLQQMHKCLKKGVLKICSKFTGEHPCRSAISSAISSTWVFSCKFAAYFPNNFS